MRRAFVVAALLPLLLSLAGAAGSAERCVMGGELVKVKAELFYSGQWNDITEFVYNRDPIQIRRGISNEGGRADPGTLTLTLNNRDGRFSPRNPRSPLYSLIGRNTPIRVSAALDDGSALSVRFVGEVVQWPPRWDVSGNDVYVPVEAAGILRRLGIPGKPLRDPLYRWTTQQSPLRYWPMNEGSLSVAGRSVVGGAPLTRGAVWPGTWGDGTLTPWLDQALLLGINQQGASISAPITGQSESGWTLDFAAKGNETFTAELVVREGTNIVFSRSTADNLRVQLYEPSPFNVLYTSSNFFSGEFGDNARHLRWTVTQNGADIDWEVSIDGTSEASDTISGEAMDQASKIFLLGEDLNIGHATLWDGTPPALADAYDAFRGHPGETAGRRIERLCSEESVAFTSTGDLDDTVAMGPQRPRRFLNLLDEAAVADAAGSRLPILVEQRAALGLHMNTRASFHVVS